jgi:hypothetical protein
MPIKPITRYSLVTVQLAGGVALAGIGLRTGHWYYWAIAGAALVSSVWTAMRE